jgi:DNA-binding beta-propeller fold protein YncE
VNNSPTTDFAIVNGSIYYYDVSYNEDWTTVVTFGKMQVAADGLPTISPLITDNVSMVFPFGIAVHPETGEIYIADAGDSVNPGSVFIFDSQGKKKDEFTVGINPCKFVFY